MAALGNLFGALPADVAPGDNIYEKWNTTEINNMLAILRAYQSSLMGKQFFTPVFVQDSKGGASKTSNNSTVITNIGAATAWKLYQITAFVGDGAVDNAYQARLINETNGALGPDTIVVRCMSYPRVSGKIGRQNLRNCFPNYIVGDQIRAVDGAFWDGGATVSGAIALDTFWKYCNRNL